MEYILIMCQASEFDKKPDNIFFFYLLEKERYNLTFSSIQHTVNDKAEAMSSPPILINM